MANNTIIIASMGRSASTLLYQSIVSLLGYNKSLSKFRRRLSMCNYSKGAVYKTHDFPPPDPPEHAKFIWTFADPYEIVISVLRQEDEKGIDWIEGHFDNLHGEFDKYRDIFAYDCLHLEEHFDKWYKKQDFDLVTVKYRAIWDYQKELSQFVGRYIELPSFNGRPNRFKEQDDNIRQLMEKTYEDLHEKVKKADDFKKW